MAKGPHERGRSNGLTQPFPTHVDPFAWKKERPLVIGGDANSEPAGNHYDSRMTRQVRRSLPFIAKGAARFGSPKRKGTSRELERPLALTCTVSAHTSLLGQDRACHLQ